MWSFDNSIQECWGLLVIQASQSTWKWIFDLTLSAKYLKSRLTAKTHSTVETHTISQVHHRKSICLIGYHALFFFGYIELNSFLSDDTRILLTVFQSSTCLKFESQNIQSILFLNCQIPLLESNHSSSGIIGELPSVILTTRCFFKTAELTLSLTLSINFVLLSK